MSVVFFNADLVATGIAPSRGGPVLRADNPAALNCSGTRNAEHATRLNVTGGAT